MPDQPDNPLNLSPEQMRALGYRVVDMIVSHHERIREKPVLTRATRAELQAKLHEPPPESPSDPRAVLDQVEDLILPNMGFATHPRFFAYIPGPSNFVGAMGDALASGFNVISALWLEASGPAQIELTAIEWLSEWCGLGTDAGGLFVSGGSVANLTGLAVAREIALSNQVHGAKVYCSDQTHGSLQKNLKLLGFAADQVEHVDSDKSGRLRPARLREVISADKAHGKRPFCVIANAGTTNTGAVDPMPEIRSICDEHEMWLHVDGAYGVPAVLTEQGKQLLRGLETADSIAVDPHKWLFQPFEIGCLLVRNASWLPRTFSQSHEYMQDAEVGGSDPEINFCDHGIQLSRSFRALKFWMTVKTFGAGALRTAIADGISLAEYCEARLRAHECFEVTTSAQLGIVSFRYLTANEQESNALNLALAERVLNDGYSMLSSTQLKGKTCLRMCTINPETTHQDIDRTIAKIVELGESLR